MGIINAADNLYEKLLLLLEQMDACAQIMEDIVAQEEVATHDFDGDVLESLAEQRARCQSKMVELESQCKRLLQHYHAAESISLEHFIETYVQRGEKKSLQHKRKKLLQRMERMQLILEENRIRLHAAWCVTMHVLQEVGAIPVQEAYGRGAVR